MRNEIFNLLRTFDKKEISNFGKFLSSSYFNKNKNVTVLFSIISHYHPLYTSKNLDKEYLYKKVFKSGNFNESNLKNLFHQLLILCEKFLIINRIKFDSLDSTGYLLKEFIDKEQKNLFLRKDKLLNKNFDHFYCFEGRYFFDLYYYQCQLYNYKNFNEKTIKKKKALEQVDLLNNAAISLTIFYISEIVSQYVNQTIMKGKYNISSIDSYSELLLKQLDFNILPRKSIKNNYNEFLNLYIYLYKLFSETESVGNYKNYKCQLVKFEKILNRNEISFHYFCLISYLILERNKKPNSRELINELYKIYTIFINNEYYLNNKIDFLPVSLFRAALFMGITIGDLEQIKKFVDENSQKVHPRDKDNIYNYGYAYYYYLSGILEKSLGCLNKIDLTYFIFKFDIKILKLKIYYELGYYEGALQDIHAYKELIRVDNIVNTRTKLLHKNFINYLEKIVLYNYSNEDIDINCLKQEILKNDSILYKDWLIKQLSILSEIFILK